MLSAEAEKLFYYTFKIVILRCKQSVAVKRLMRLILQNFVSFVIFARFEVMTSSMSKNLFDDGNDATAAGH